TEVDLQARNAEADAARLAVQDHVPHAGLRHRRIQFRRGRHAALTAVEAPRLGERTRSDVEAAFGFASPGRTTDEQIEEPFLDDDWAGSSGGIQPRHLAVVAEHRQLVFE